MPTASPRESPREELLDLVDGSEMGTSQRSAGRQSNGGFGARHSPLGSSGTPSTSAGASRVIQTTAVLPVRATLSSHSSGSVDSDEDLAGYTAVLGVSGHAADANITGDHTVGGGDRLSPNEGGGPGILGAAGEPDEAFVEKEASRNRFSSLCVFVTGSVLFLVGIASIAFIAAFTTESVLTEGDKQAAESTARSTAFVQRLQLNFITAVVTSFAGSLPRDAAALNGSTPPNFSPNAPGSDLVNGVGFIEKADGVIRGQCSRSRAGDSDTCPPAISLTMTVLTDLAEPAVAMSAQAAYHQALTHVLFPSPSGELIASSYAMDVDAYNESAYPGGLATVQTMNGGHAMLLDEMTLHVLPADLSSALRRNVTTTGVPVTQLHAAIDTIGFSLGNGTPTALFTTPSDGLRRIFDPRSAVAQVLALSCARGLVADPFTDTLRSSRVDNVTFGNGKEAVVVSSGGMLISSFANTLRPQAFSRSCLVVVGLHVTTHRVLGCRRSDEPEEATYSVFDIDSARLTGRLQNILQAARVVRRTTHNDTHIHVDGYQLGQFRIGKPTHKVAFAYISAVEARLVPGVPYEMHDMWMVNIELKASTVIADSNVPLKVGFIIFSLIAVVTLVYFVAVYFAFVKPLGTMRRRMAQVARLDFALVPEDMPASASFDLPDEDDGGEGLDSGERAAKTADALKREWQQKRERLFPDTRILEVRLLFEDFFHVANALRSVVPFLPEAYRRPDTPDEDGEEGPESPFTGHGSGLATTTGNGGAARRRDSSTEETTDDDEASPTCLSSLSEIDLSEFRAGTGASGSFTDTNSISGAFGNSTAQSSSITPQNHSAITVSPSGAQGLQARPPAIIVSPRANGGRPSLSSELVTPTGAASGRRATMAPGSKGDPSPMSATPAASGLTASTSANPLRVSASHASGVVPAIPDRAKHRYANETQNKTVIVAYFSLYLRKAARVSHDVAADVQREFISASMSFTALRKGQASALAPHHLVAIWSGANAETKACNAALDFYRHLKKWGEARGASDAFRVSVGLAHGPATVGVLGTAFKKFFVCDGPAVQRAAIMASTGLHNHAAVVVSAFVRDSLKMFATLRPLDQVAFPRTLRRERVEQIEIAYQCLFLDENEDDEEWMYRLEKKGETGTSVCIPLDGSPLADTQPAVSLPVSLQPLEPLPPRGDKSEMGCYYRGYAAWCQGHLVVARREFNLALSKARAAGHDDRSLTRRVDLLNEMHEKVADFEQRFVAAASPSDSSPNRHSSGSNTPHSSFHDTTSSSLIHQVTEATVAPSLVRRASSIIAGGSSSGGNDVDGSVLSHHVRRAIEFFDAVLRGRPYARMAAQLGVETFQFEA